MREAWFEVIKRTGSDSRKKRTPKQQKAADEANIKTGDINRRKEAALQEYRNWTGPQATEFDIKGKTGGEAGIKNIQEATKLARRKAGQPQKGDYRGKAEVMGRNIKEGAKKTKEGLSQGVRNILGRGKKALSPNTYLPDPSATGTGKPVDIRAKDPISGKPKFNRITTRENEEAKDTAGFKDQMGQFQQRAIAEPLVEAEEAQKESERKKKLRGNIASQAAQQAQLDRLEGDKVAEETKAQEEYDAFEQQRLESGRKAGEVADEQARKDLIAEQQKQIKATRDAKIKEMGEVNRQRAEAAREAARKEANTTVMPKIGGLKPAPFKMQKPAALSGKPMINLNRQSQGKSNLTGPPKPTMAQRAQAGNDRAMEAARANNPNVFQQMVANQSAYDRKKEKEEEAKKNPNAATQQQAPVNTPPPPPPPQQQQQQQNVPLPQQQQNVPLPSAKQSAWFQGMKRPKPQAPPPKAPPKQPNKVPVAP